MLREFEQKFGGTVEASLVFDDVDSLRQSAGDRMFGGGLYRVLSKGRAKALAPEVFSAFPDYTQMAECFATDWLGRVFALRKDTHEVVMFEPGTAEALNIGVSFADFHQVEIVNYTEEVFAAAFFERWKDAGHDVPAPDHCAGYEKPLFQGGADEVSNLAMINLDVYWTVTAPFIAKARRAFASH